MMADLYVSRESTPEGERWWAEVVEGEDLDERILYAGPMFGTMREAHADGRLWLLKHRPEEARRARA